MHNILCIAAHPDDVELGMGGTLNRFCNEKKKIKIIICYYHSENRKQETINACNILGISDENIYFIENTEDPRNMIKQMDKLFMAIKPDTVFTHFNGDTHQEHKITCDITLSCCRNINCSIYMWENTQPGGASYNQFKTNFYVLLNNENIQNKINALSHHKSQMTKYNSEKLYDFIINKSHMHGYYVNSDAAEAFFQIKAYI